MNIIVSGIHLSNLPELESYAREKAEKLIKFHPKLEELQIRLFEEKAHKNQNHDFGCEIKAVIPGNDLEIFESDTSMHQAIDKAIDRMKRTLVKSKEKNFSYKR